MSINDTPNQAAKTNDGRFSPEERAAIFMDWCALHGFGISGWPPGALEQLIQQIRQAQEAGHG